MTKTIAHTLKMVGCFTLPILPSVFVAVTIIVLTNASICWMMDIMGYSQTSPIFLERYPIHIFGLGSLCVYTLAILGLLSEYALHRESRVMFENLFTKAAIIITMPILIVIGSLMIYHLLLIVSIILFAALAALGLDLSSMPSEFADSYNRFVLITSIGLLTAGVITSIIEGR